MTTFSRLSFLGEEEMSLCQVALTKKTQSTAIALKEHKTNFHWILNGYHGSHNLSLKFFQKRLLSLGPHLTVKKRLEELSCYTQTKKKEIKTIEQRYRLSPSMKIVAHLTRQASYLQDQRKKIVLQSMPAITKIYKELSHRLNISFDSSLYITSPEIGDCLRKKISKDLILKRKQGFRFYYKLDTYQSSLINFEDFFNFLDSAYVGKDINNIKGMIAYPGNVIGRVRLLKGIKDIVNFKKGEILVALMTSPDYIIAMKKAKAILTDDGGLTCHAAIIARELKIPCIVGTRNATKILKNHDLIEFNANKGEVRIINKK